MNPTIRGRARTPINWHKVFPWVPFNFCSPTLAHAFLVCVSPHTITARLHAVYIAEGQCAAVEPQVVEVGLDPVPPEILPQRDVRAIQLQPPAEDLLLLQHAVQEEPQHLPSETIKNVMVAADKYNTGLPTF